MRTHFSIHRRRTAHNHIITQCSHNLPIKFKVPHFVFLSHPSRPNSQTQPTPAHSFLRLTGSFCPGTEPGNVVQPVSLLCRAGVVSCCSVCSKSPDVSCCSVRLWWCHGPGIICTSEIGAVDIEDTGDGSTCRGHRGHRVYKQQDFPSPGPCGKRETALRAAPVHHGLPNTAVAVGTPWDIHGLLHIVRPTCQPDEVNAPCVEPVRVIVVEGAELQEHGVLVAGRLHANSPRQAEGVLVAAIIIKSYHKRGAIGKAAAKNARGTNQALY